MDEDFVKALKVRNVDVLTVADAGMFHRSDEEQLDWAKQNGRVIFSFNTKDYKLPNGITLEFGDEEPVSKQQLLKNKKGSIEIRYTRYTINKGIPPHIF